MRPRWIRDLSALLALCLLAVGPVLAQQRSVSRSNLGRDMVRNLKPEMMLEARQIGGDVLERWAGEFRETRPTIVAFRWSTDLADLRWAGWRVGLDPVDRSRVVASGSLPIPEPGGVAGFDVDFRTIQSPSPGAAATYWIWVTGETTVPTANGSRVAQVGSRPLPVTFTQSWTPTVFTEGGLRPELHSRMPVSIDLRTLHAVGDDGVEPYLLVAVVYMDGTTIRPQVDVASRTIRFRDSRVRIDSASRTHGNILGDVRIGPVTGASMSSGQTVGIPPETGHFETTIRPVGLEIADLFEGDGARQLRENTFVGILVVGMEEDAVPSTEAMDRLRVDLVHALQKEFDAALRGTILELSDAAPIAELAAAVGQANGAIVEHLRRAVRAQTLAESLDHLLLNTVVTLGFSPMAMNADDFIGVDAEIFDYQQLLDAGDRGVGFTLDLSNRNEALRYTVKGRIGAR